MEVVAAFAAAAAASGAGAPGGSPDQPATVAGTPQAQQRVAGVGSSPSRRTAAIAAQHAQLAHAAVEADLPADATRFAPLMPPVSAQSQVLSSPPPPTGAFPLPPPHSFPPPPLSAPRAGGSSSGGRSGSGSVSGTSRRKAASGGVTDNSAQRAALITVVSGLLAALLIAALVRMRHMNESRAGARPSLASASTSAPVVPQPTLPVPAFDEPTSTNGLAPGTPASASPSPSPSPPGNAAAPAGGARGVVRSPTSGRRPATASSARPGCDPPYFFDPQGVKIYKPDCVE